MIGIRRAVFFSIFLGVSWAGNAHGHEPARHGPAAPATKSHGPAVMVELQAKVRGDLPWRFWPDRRVIRVRRGENVQILYRARNLGERPTMGKAIHSILPDGAEAELDLVECFCFVQATLAAGEERTFPLAFRLRSTLPPRVRHVVIRYEFAPEVPEGPVTAPPLSPSTATLEIWAKATRTDGVRLRVVSVGIEGLIKPGLAGWFQLPTSADLLAAEGIGHPAKLLRSTVPAGAYRALRLQAMAFPSVAEETSKAILLHSAPVAISFTALPEEKTILMLNLTVRQAGERGYEVQIERVSATSSFRAPIQ